MSVKLNGLPQHMWGNAILFQLAEALGYDKSPNGEVINADPDEVLEQTLEALWRLEDLDR